MNDTPMKPYAITPQQTRGRCHPESIAAPENPFVIDRRRIVHSASFRRLQYKTQVFVASEDDHFRTRLTHTLEVAGIARRLARMLDVNELLAETIALAHDLGHPPFGHAGEEALSRCMKDHGGFEHNVQSLRSVEYLEHPYPPFRGLNLTYELREGLAKHHTAYDKPARHELADGSRAPLEAQIACIADRIAYDCHDLEDAIGAELVSEKDLQSITLWQDAAESIRGEFPDRPLHAIRRPILDHIENRLLDDVVRHTTSAIDQAGIQTADDIRRQNNDLAAFSAPMQQQAEELEKFLFTRVYRHYRLIRMDDKARRFIEEVFAAYVENPNLLPPRYAARVAKQGLHRVVCDYIAGMTDRFCQDEYKRLFLPHERI